MSAIDEGIVREFFEHHGFFVRQVRKYQVQSRKKTGEEEIDLLVYNPAYQPGGRKPDFFLFSSELPRVQRAVVAVKPWHTEVFTPGMLKNAPEIFGFLEKNVVKQVNRFFPQVQELRPGSQDGAGESSATVGASRQEDAEGTGPKPVEEPTKILVLPALPTAEPYRSQSVQLLKERGVDAIISFRAMLQDLVDSVETNRNYGKSDTLQIIRVLKNYDLIKDPQMDLLGLKGRGQGGG